MTQNTDFSSPPYYSEINTSNRELVEASQRHVYEYSIDNNSFSLWPQKINTIKQYGDFRIKWVIKKRHDIYYPYYYYATVKLISIGNDNCWQHFNNFRVAAKQKYFDFIDAVLEEKKSQARKRANERARKRRKELKLEAQKLNITVEELKERNRKNKNKFRTTKRDVEQTKRLITLGPYLKSLQDEIATFTYNLDNEPSKVRVIHLDRSIRSIEKTTELIKAWNK